MVDSEDEAVKARRRQQNRDAQRRFRQRHRKRDVPSVRWASERSESDTADSINGSGDIISDLTATTISRMHSPGPRFANILTPDSFNSGSPRGRSQQLHKVNSAWSGTGGSSARGTGYSSHPVTLDTNISTAEMHTEDYLAFMNTMSLGDRTSSTDPARSPPASSMSQEYTPSVTRYDQHELGPQPLSFELWPAQAPRTDHTNLASDTNVNVLSNNSFDGLPHSLDLSNHTNREFDSLMSNRLLVSAIEYTNKLVTLYEAGVAMDLIDRDDELRLYLRLIKSRFRALSRSDPLFHPPPSTPDFRSTGEITEQFLSAQGVPTEPANQSMYNDSEHQQDL